jgi:hypothetical protein
MPVSAVRSRPSAPTDQAKSVSLEFRRAAFLMFGVRAARCHEVPPGSPGCQFAVIAVSSDPRRAYTYLAPRAPTQPPGISRQFARLRPPAPPSQGARCHACCIRALKSGWSTPRWLLWLPCRTEDTKLAPWQRGHLPLKRTTPFAAAARSAHHPDPTGHTELPT